MCFDRPIQMSKFSLCDISDQCKFDSASEARSPVLLKMQGFPIMHCAVPRLCIRCVPCGWKQLFDLFLVPRVSCNHFRHSSDTKQQSISNHNTSECCNLTEPQSGEGVKWRIPPIWVFLLSPPHMNVWVSSHIDWLNGWLQRSAVCMNSSLFICLSVRIQWISWLRLTVFA